MTDTIHSAVDTATTDPSPADRQILAPPRLVAIRIIIALMLREMSATYGRSPGGYLWAVIQPIGMILLLSVGFSLLVRSPALGTSFLLFYATGYLPFDMYGTLAAKVAQALMYSRPLLAYPRVTWLDAVLARAILNFLTLTTVFCILMTAILLVAETHSVIRVVPIITGLIMAGALGVGIGILNSVLGGLFPVWTLIWGILSRPLFIASGIFFLYEDMPRSVQNILWWNPLMHIIGWMRTGFYPTYHASYVSLTYVIGLILLLNAAGLLFLRAHYKTVLQA